MDICNKSYLYCYSFLQTIIDVYGADERYKKAMILVVDYIPCKECGCSASSCKPCHAIREFARPQSICSNWNCRCHVFPVNEVG